MQEEAAQPATSATPEPIAPTTSTAVGLAERILLIGGSGYVGDGLRPRLRDAGFQVRLLVRRAADAERFTSQGYETALGDITDRDSLARAMPGVGATINLVGLIKERGQATWERVHYQGTLNVIEAAQAVGVRRLLQMSALGAGDLPDYPYHFTKWRADNAIAASELDWTIFRPSIIFGPGDKVHFISQLADLIRSAPLVPVVGKGDARFQPVALDDVADCFIAALRDPATSGQTYDLAGPDVVTYEEILDECMRALGRHKRKVHVPVGLMSPLMSLLSTLPIVEPPVTTEQLKMLKLNNTTATNAVERLLGRPPTPMYGHLGYIAQG